MVKLLCALLALLAVASSSAQLGGKPRAPPAAGAGQSVADAVCANQDLKTFCTLINAGKSNPAVAELFDPTFSGTVFAPRDSAFQSDGPKLARTLGASSLDVVTSNPNLAARVVANHIIPGVSLQFAQLKNDDKFRNALNLNLEVDTGTLGGAGSLLGGLYIKGPENTVRLRSTDNLNNILAGRAYVHETTGVLIPSKA